MRPSLLLLPLALVVGCASPRSSGKALTLAAKSPPTAAAAPPPIEKAATATTKDAVELEKARHALSRFAFGPRPGDVERVAAMGTDAWLRAQLAPGKDAAVEAKVGKLPVTKLATAEVLDGYDGKGKGDGTPMEVGREIAAAKLIRAVESERQLEEVLVDFWFNHFNVDAKKGAVKWLVAPYERDAIRAHVFGNFRAMLGATAKHPAMLFYLDNWLSTSEGKGAAQKGKGKKHRGLNENYARELLELHTLGVDGGYGQDDVKEVARAFTGWSIEKPKAVGAFVFRPAMHEGGPKKVLGKTIDAGGVGDGEAVLDLLATHPTTAKFLATALARRFVSDEPPKELVDKVAAAFLASKGDLRKTYEALFAAPETWAEAARGAKTKDPFETVVSAVRAVGGTIELAGAGKHGPAQAIEPLVKTLDGLGEPLYRCAPPTGFPEKASAWIGTGALVGRIRFAVALTEDRFRLGDAGVVWEPAKVVPKGSAPLVERVARALLHRDLAPATRAAIDKELAGLPPDTDDDARLRRAVALVLGSPDFQHQ